MGSLIGWATWGLAIFLVVNGAWPAAIVVWLVGHAIGYPIWRSEHPYA